MKTLKKSILTLSFLFAACILVKAELPNKAGKNANDVLVKYIENTTIGQSHNFNELLGDDFKQYIDCDKKLLNYNKKQFINYLKLSKDVVFNCETDYSLVEETEDFVIAKVDMKFPTFTKTNYVTISNTEEGWKITNITVKYS
jgi:hypothetical protein